MEFNEMETAMVLKTTTDSVELQVRELNDLHLALIGGGGGAIVIIG